MVLKVKDVKNIIEKHVPLNLKEDYDNVGFMIGDLESEVSSILIALDCTLEVIDEAINLGANLIITHHPLLFIKPQSITTETLQGKKIIKLIKNDINLYSSHTNLDKVRGGLNDIISEILGYNEWEIIEIDKSQENKDLYGIGRIITLNNTITLKELCNNIKNFLQISKLRYAGKENMIINKIAIINGSGESYFKKCKELGADCIITGDTSYHYVSDYLEEGIGIIDAGHFETEWPALKLAAKKLQEKIREIGADNNVIISKMCKSPYKFI
ncbi:Nif3-like dinuclear metal center hexameric protein [Clostridium prolinivorans]|uniref:Nif3-like dinuclear metal center hexameric protein n=1 Tax=Clostridium prolinivorans TaxID=2769420 RepID=UPI000FDA5DC0|nr:Nif3-like dinuclear metal center hexameric protein [Clostridium prolinivorans]